MVLFVSKDLQREICLFVSEEDKHAHKVARLGGCMSSVGLCRKLLLHGLWVLTSLSLICFITKLENSPNQIQ